MSGKILLDKDLPTDLRFKALVRRVRDALASRVTDPRDAAFVTYELSESVTLGALAKLWILGDTHIRGDNSLDGTVDQIDQLAGVAGFCNLLPAYWFKVLDAERVQLPDFLEHNGTTAKKNASHANRQARYRNKHRVTPDAGVASRVTQGRDARASPSHPIPSHPIPNQEKRVRATRLPPDFDLTPDRKAVAEKHGLDADRVFAMFRDYWLAASGRSASKHDWDAAWRLWCAKEVGRKGMSPADIADAARRRATDAGWSRVKAHATAIGCPLQPTAMDTPDTFEFRVKNWENCDRPRGSGGQTAVGVTLVSAK
jgi:hypothetical protein